MGMRYSYSMEETFHYSEEQCDSCGRWLSGEEWLVGTQSHSAWGASFSEAVVRGYDCWGCGERRRF